MQWVQLASEEQVFLLDVPALCARHAEALQGTLGKLLAAPHVLKVGFGLRGKQRAESALQSLGVSRAQRGNVQEKDLLLTRKLHPLQLELAPPRIHIGLQAGAHGVAGFNSVTHH